MSNTSRDLYDPQLRHHKHHIYDASHCGAKEPRKAPPIHRRNPNSNSIEFDGIRITRIHADAIKDTLIPPHLIKKWKPFTLSPPFPATCRPPCHAGTQIPHNQPLF